MTARTLLAAVAVLLVLEGVTFAVAIKAGKHSVVDTAWGVGIALVALTAFLTSLGHGDPARRALLLAASAAWGLRLAVYVGWRNHGKPEDPRYADLLGKARGSKNLYALRQVYLLQAVTLWLATVPVQLGMLEPAPVGPLVIAGVVLFVVGLSFESVGDWQLARFKARHEGQVMDRGLWRYTRHPNYFGDFCMWWGLFAISAASWRELPAILGPLLMTFILTRGTGARMTDRRMRASRPQYADYIARTSGFFPLPPRRLRPGQ
jgi:steroid 5-alpha reductase family enzyme